MYIVWSNTELIKESIKDFLKKILEKFLKTFLVEYNKEFLGESIDLFQVFARRISKWILEGLYELMPGSIS